VVRRVVALGVELGLDEVFGLVLPDELLPLGEFDGEAGLDGLTTGGTKT
jgi:hypothetical protein